MAYKVFVSYSTDDIQNVALLRQYLQFPNVECFVSEYSVTPGVELAPTIKAAIQGCDLFILLWSRNAAASKWVPQEIGIAHGAQKFILPLVLTEGLSLPGFIGNIRYVPAYRNLQQAYLKLREDVLRKSIAKQNEQFAALTVGGALLLFLIASMLEKKS